MAVSYSTIAEKVMKMIQGYGLSLKMFDCKTEKVLQIQDRLDFSISMNQI